MRQSTITKEQLKDLVIKRLTRAYSTDPEKASEEQIYRALADVVVSLLEERYRHHEAKTYGQGAKQVYYLSMEFLIGRSLKNHLYNLDIQEQTAEIMKEFGLSLERIYEVEPDAGLGNGGLGRLAACYMDALATEGYLATGYSIMYEFGIFRQKIIDGWQQELADNWLPRGDVWLVERRQDAVEVRFDGSIDEKWMNGYHFISHEDYNPVLAIPYDMYISGYDSPAVSRLRLWKAQAPGIDMESFNRGDYAAAVRANGTAELISKILYPNDNHMEGKVLRLRQQYFLCSASINDLVRNHMAQYGTLENLPLKVAIQLNDTHPTLAIPELIRIMLDDCGYSWDKAVSIAMDTFAYTNHTVLSEALETWNIEMFRSVLPRIYQIIEELDRQLQRELWDRFPGDIGKISYMRILDKSHIRMANLCVYMSHRVNGVSALHGQIIKDEVFNDYYLFAPQRFTSVTNGIAYRRWLLQSNPGLTTLLDETIGQDYRYDASHLSELAAFAGDAAVLDRIGAVKLENKKRLGLVCDRTLTYPIDPASMFDVQAKRLHEYKRQHLSALHIVYQYLSLKDDPDQDFVPRTYLFGAKAAPGYFMAKQIIRLLWGLGQLLEQDEQLRDRLRVVYIEDYRVTTSEILMPAAEVSEQISLAGKEASGTGNMKMMLNGAITIGTLDGANVEIRQAAGEDNFFQFGMTREEVLDIKAEYDPASYYNNDPNIRRAIDFIAKGFAGNTYTDIASNLKQSDPYMVLADFESYRASQHKLAQAWTESATWNRMSLMNIAASGFFSADRAIREYARNIWNLATTE